MWFLSVNNTHLTMAHVHWDRQLFLFNVPTVEQKRSLKKKKESSFHLIYCKGANLESESLGRKTNKTNLKLEYVCLFSFSYSPLCAMQTSKGKWVLRIKDIFLIKPHRFFLKIHILHCNAKLLKIFLRNMCIFK